MKLSVRSQIHAAIRAAKKARDEHRSFSEAKGLNEACMKRLRAIDHPAVKELARIYMLKCYQLRYVIHRMEGSRIWRRHTPSLYVDTDPNRLPYPEVSKAATDLLIDDDQPGVLLFGATGSGKTRTGYLLLRRWVESRCWHPHHPDFRVIKPREIRDEAAKRAKNGTVDEFIDELVDNEILFVDDIGHGTFTPTYAETLLEIVERFTSERRILVVSTQASGPALVRQWAKDEPSKKATAEAIVRRLNEFCRLVRFERPKA